MANKGGGVAGAVSYPAYIETRHGDWLGVGAIDVDITEAMNSILDPGDPGVKSSCTITCIIANDIANDEGFTLTSYTGTPYVFKFNKDGGGVTGEDFEVAIETGDSANEVASFVATAIQNTGLFSVGGGVPAVPVTQTREGTDGNQNNADTVTDVDFTITNFVGGIDTTTINPYTGVSSYNPEADLTKVTDDFVIYKAFVDSLYPEGDLARHAGAALAEAGDTNFPPIDIAAAVETIVTAAIANASTAVASARGDAASDVEDSVSRARSKAAGDASMAISSAISAAVQMVDSAPIADMIAQFGQRAEVAHLKALNRFAGGLAEINAVQGSAFLFGMALMEAEHTEKVDEFVAQLSMQVYSSVVPYYLTTELGFSRDQLGLETAFSADQLQTFRERALIHIRAQTALDAQVRGGRDTFFRQAVDDLSGMLSRQIAAKQNVVSTGAEAYRIKFIALSERDKQDVLYDVEEWLWQLKLYQYASNVLSGVSTGGQVLPERPSQMSTALGGAFAGAALGLKAGAAVGPIAGAVGLGIGALIGGAAGYEEGNY